MVSASENLNFFETLHVKSESKNIFFREMFLTAMGEQAMFLVDPTNDSTGEPVLLNLNIC